METMPWLWRNSTYLEQYADEIYNAVTEGKGFKLFDYNSLSKLGNKKASELFYEIKQGKREYLEKVIGTAYADPDKFESKILVLQFKSRIKSRTKYSNEMLPLAETKIDSFRFT